MAALNAEHEQWELTSGVPVSNGYIYIGARNQDPVLNPITIYADRALTTPLANPQRTDALGRSENKIWVPGRYSIKVEDEDNVQLYQELDAGETPESGVTLFTNVQGINAITAEATPGISSYTDNEIYVFTAVSTNTGAVTVDAGPGAISLHKNNSEELAAGEIQANQVVMSVYNEGANTLFLLNPINFITTRGDLIRGNANGAPARIPLGPDGQLLGSDGADVDYLDRTILGTPQDATGSPTAITFTGIPSWAHWIDLNISELSTNGTSTVIVQIGDSGGLVTSGYLGAAAQVGGTSASTAPTVGLALTTGSWAASRVAQGTVRLSLLDAATHLWSLSWVGGDTTPAGLFAGARLALSNALDRVSITTAGGTDAFDGNTTVNIQYG